MKPIRPEKPWTLPRREFLCAAGAAAAGVAMSSKGAISSALAGQAAPNPKGQATVRVAFLYPSTQAVKETGYYSWPGIGFDPEGRQKTFMGRIEEIGRQLGTRIVMDAGHLTAAAEIARFIEEVKQNKPDGLLLVAFKKSEWDSVKRIISETGLPAIVMATIGVLLITQINELNRTPGVHMISALDDFEAIAYGLRMIRTIRRMRESLILSVGGTATKESTVPKLGTRVRAVPMQQFADLYKATPTNDEVKGIARAYLTEAKERREPTEDDVLEAARAYVACKRLVADEQADAIMMDCLSGIRDGRIPPPCMAFMSLRDEGIVAGCQNELNPALSMMLVQELFGKPGFQHNAVCDTQENLFVGAHCTSPRKLAGPTGPAAPYILRNHAEAGVGAVPQVLWPVGQEVTIAHYLSGDAPQMLVYSGKVVRCLDMPPAGGCRTNVVVAINEIPEACDVKGMHQTMFQGNHARQLRAFCQLVGITAVT